MNRTTTRGFRAAVGPSLPAVAGLICGLVLAGCGSDADPPPFGEFTGIWDLELTMAGQNPFQTTCTDTSNQTAALEPFFGGMRLERGTLTDLVETSWECRLTYDVQGMTARPPNPDPYTTVAPGCSFLYTILDDPTGMTSGTAIFATLEPVDRWNLNLQPAQANMAPTAQLDLSGRIIRTDINIDTGMAMEYSSCTFATNPVPKMVKVTRD